MRLNREMIKKKQNCAMREHDSIKLRHARKEYPSSSMPVYPMGKLGNCPGPRAQGGPALAEGVI